MKYLFAVLSVSLVLIGVLPLRAQQQYVIEWESVIDNGNDDEAYGIAIDKNGNIYVTGQFLNLSTSNYDFLTIKYDASGNVMHRETLNVRTYDYEPHIAVDLKGNIYVVGQPSDQWDVGYYYYTVKYDSLWNISWSDSLSNGGGHDHAHDIAVDTIGNVYITGQSSIPSASYHDYCFTVKYNLSGSILWADTLGISGLDPAGEGRGIALDNNGNVYVAGHGQITSDTSAWFVAKYDSTGHIQWVDTLVYNGMAKDIAVDKDGEIYVTGSEGPYSVNILTVKFDSLGNIIRADTILPPDAYTAWFTTGIAVDEMKNIYLTGNYNTYYNFALKYDSLGNIVWIDTTSWKEGSDWSIALDNQNNIYITGQAHNANHDYLTLKYVKYKDAGILSIVSPDTVGTDSSYTPQIWVKNNSYEDTLSFDIGAFIDSVGGNLYSDTQSVSNLPVGDSVLVGFSQWTAPSNPVDLNLRFSIITGDMNADNDTISKPLYVKDMSGILNKGINRRTILNVSTINKGNISFSYNIAKSGVYNIILYTIDGRIIRKIEGRGSGYHSGKISNLPSGIYFLRLKQEEDVVNKKVILVK